MRTIATLFCALLASPLGHTQTQAMDNSRQCEVIDGVVVCRSQADAFANLNPGEKGQAVYSQTAAQHGPAIGYGGPGYGDSQSRFIATITQGNGIQHHREVRLKYLENVGVGDMRIAVFDKPNDLRRYALLTLSYEQGLDEQWLYDPDSKQVKRLPSNNASTPFYGMDINYEDISSQDLAKYDYEYVAQTQYQGQPVHVVNRFPKNKYSGYGRLETWLTQDQGLILKVDYYDDNENLVKTLTLDDYQQFQDKYWRAKRMLMKNHRSGGSTELVWSEYRFNTGLTASDFTPASLRNIN